MPKVRRILNGLSGITNTGIQQINICVTSHFSLINIMGTSRVVPG